MRAPDVLTAWAPHSVRNGYIDKAEEMVRDFGPKVLKAVSEFGQTALHCAVESGDLAMLEMMLRAHVDPAVVDGDGNTALMAAVARGRLDMAEAIAAVAAPADVQAAAALAERSGNASIADALRRRIPK